MNKKLQELISDIDKPLEFNESWSFLKRGKIKITIIFEDQSYKDYYVKNAKDYRFRIKTKSYVIFPECLLPGKHPWFVYYYNNPLPIKLKFENSKLTLIKEGKVMLDAKSFDNIITTSLVNSIYQEGNFWSTKNIIIIIVAVGIMILVMLQLTGKVDIMGTLVGMGGARG